MLYAVSALFALLSLFLLWPTGSTLGLVLAVLGSGIWLGVQHLGYLEFGEIRRVAQRTMEQRDIFINNLAIRRATEELKVGRDYDQLCRILHAAFSNNDFDGFDLNVNLLPKERACIKDTTLLASDGTLGLRWSKPGRPKLTENLSVWNLKLDLVTTGNRHRGSMNLYRMYCERTLLLDINLLTSVFPVALADALDRAFACQVETLAQSARGTDYVIAPAG